MSHGKYTKMYHNERESFENLFILIVEKFWNTMEHEEMNWWTRITIDILNIQIYEVASVKLRDVGWNWKLFNFSGWLNCVKVHICVIRDLCTERVQSRWPCRKVLFLNELNSTQPQAWKELMNKRMNQSGFNLRKY